MMLPYDIKNILKTLQSESGCLSRQVGAVVYSPGEGVLGVGRNTTLSEQTPCTQTGICIRRESDNGGGLDDCVAVHAEVNAVFDAINDGYEVAGTIVYCTDKPCIECLKILILVGIVKVYYIREYPMKPNYIAYDQIASDIDMEQIDE